jgi:hypothetical protein
LFTPLCVGFHRNESQWRHDLTSIGVSSMAIALKSPRPPHSSHVT